MPTLTQALVLVALFATAAMLAGQRNSAITPTKLIIAAGVVLAMWLGLLNDDHGVKRCPTGSASCDAEKGP